MTWLMTGQEPAIPPPGRQSHRRRISDVGEFASRFHDSKSARRASESSPVFEDSPPPTTDDSAPVLPYEVESAVPSSAPASPRPSQRLIEMAEDASVQDPSENIHASPPMRDDVDLDDDIPVWDPDEEPVMKVLSDLGCDFTQDQVGAYQQHLSHLMQGLGNARGGSDTVESTAPPAVGDGKSGEGKRDKGKGKAKVVESDGDDGV